MERETPRTGPQHNERRTRPPLRRALLCSRRAQGRPREEGLVISSLAFWRERDDRGRRRRGTWIGTYSGARFWPRDPRAEEIHFDDLCVGLAREYRYGNQSHEPLSVAEHSVVVTP